MPCESRTDATSSSDEKRPKVSRPGSSLKRRLAVCGLALALGLVASEVAFRLLVRQRTPAGLVFDDQLVFTFAPNSTVYGLKLNDLGAVGDDSTPRTARTGPYRVFLFGGSTSFSRYYVDGLREALVRGIGHECTVTSFGRPRYTSLQAAVLAERLFPEHLPDVAVLYLGINDSIYDSFSWVDGAPRVGFLDWKDAWPPLLFQGFSYHVIDKRLRSTPDFPPGELRSESILRGHLERVIETARQNGVRVVLAEFALALPTEDPDLEATIRSQEPVMRHFWGNIDSTVRAVARHNAVVRGVAAEHDLPVAPVAQRIPRTREYFNDICHLTFAGNQILVDTIADTIIGLAIGPTIKGRLTDETG